MDDLPSVLIWVEGSPSAVLSQNSGLMETIGALATMVKLSLQMYSSEVYTLAS